MTSAKISRNDAMAQVDAAADETWKENATTSVKQICKDLGIGNDFTTDLVWVYLQKNFPNSTTHEPKALGPLMAKAAREGLIRKTGQWEESSRTECHARPVAIWQVQTVPVI